MLPGFADVKLKKRSPAKGAGGSPAKEDGGASPTSSAPPLADPALSLEQLKNKDSLPEGVDPKKLEVCTAAGVVAFHELTIEQLHLREEDFESAFGCTREKFFKLAPWQQSKKKKQAGLN